MVTSSKGTQHLVHAFPRAVHGLSLAYKVSAYYGDYIHVKHMDNDKESMAQLEVLDGKSPQST